MDNSTYLISTGNEFTDVDSLACAIAYEKYLRLTGKRAFSFVSAIYNLSITSSIYKWDIETRNVPTVEIKKAKFIIVDISDPSAFDKRVDQNNIVEIYDHHFGYEDYWKNKLGNNSHIEHVGACATLIYEKINKESLLRKLDNNCLKLLFTGILSNTLYLKANVTTERDIKAFNDLKSIANLDNNWEQNYFTEVLENIEDNLDKAINNDIKIIDFNEKTILLSQLEIFEDNGFLANNQDNINAILNRFNIKDWLFTSPIISENRTYIYTNNQSIKDFFEKVFNAEFNNNIANLDMLILRKEIVRELKKYYQ